METPTSSYLERSLQNQAQLPLSPLSWLNRLRGEALERANALRVPTTRDEDWRFTDLSPLYQSSFESVARRAAIDLQTFGQYTVPEAGARLVFVDGVYTPELSVAFSEAGVEVSSLVREANGHEFVVRDSLAQIADFQTDVFTAVNTAWLHDAAVVRLGRDTVAERPVHLLFISSTASAAAYPRVVVVVGRGSRCTVIEDYVSLHAGAGLTNAVCEIDIGEGAQVRHARLQRESGAAFHIGTCAVRCARDARYAGVNIATGARISRVNHNVLQAGDATDWEVDGLALISGRQLADTHSFLDHARPHGRSRQLHKCIVGEAAHAVFNGRIMVRPGAQRTDSAQQSRTLLLSQRAHVDTKPQLEIFADDVKCAHGATVGQLDADQMFYLRSRGMSPSTATNLLTFAFAAEVIERIGVPSLVTRLRDLVIRQTQA
jgi:Fe-S cluster assembly protein SufD